MQDLLDINWTDRAHAQIVYFQIIEERQRFRKNPHNYAVRKTQLMKQKDMAELEGDSDKMATAQSALDELEERATELDRVRTSNISSIRWAPPPPPSAAAVAVAVAAAVAQGTRLH